MTKTIKLFNSEGKALTNINSSDSSMTLPTEIVIDSDGTAIAHYVDRGSFSFDSLHELCAAYEISIEAIMAECETVEHNGEKLILVQDAHPDQDHAFVEARRCYRAAAVDTAGKQYRVTWYPYDDFDGEDESNGYRVELQWEEPDLANASAPQREAAWALLRGRPARYRGPWMKRSVAGLSLVDAEKQGRRMARDPAKRSVMIVEFTGGQSNCYRRY